MRLIHIFLFLFLFSFISTFSQDGYITPGNVPATIVANNWNASGGYWETDLVDIDLTVNALYDWRVANGKIFVEGEVDYFEDGLKQKILKLYIDEKLRTSSSSSTYKISYSGGWVDNNTGERHTFPSPNPKYITVVAGTPVFSNPMINGYHLGVPSYDPIYYVNLEESAKRFCQEMGFGYGVKSYQVNTYGGDYTYYYHYWRTGSHTTVYRITECECNDPF